MSGPLICVVDASVAIKLYLAEPLATEAHAVFACLADSASAFHVPDLFYAECGNILWRQTQRGNCTAALAASHFAGVAQLPLQRTATADLCPDALTLALAHGITVYDACYVALAQRLAIPLITADEKLANKLSTLTPSVHWLGSGVVPITP
jgi:predicted nucleic acid-binding protein